MSIKMYEVKIGDDGEIVGSVFSDPYDVAIINDDVCNDCPGYGHCAECSYFSERVAAQTRERQRMNTFSKRLLQSLRSGS